MSSGLSCSVITEVQGSPGSLCVALRAGAPATGTDAAAASSSSDPGVPFSTRTMKQWWLPCKQNLRLFTAFDQVMLSQGTLSKHTSGIPRLTSLDMVCLRSPPTWTRGLGLCQTHNQGWASSRLYSELLSGSLMDINTAFIYCVFKASRLVSMAFGTFVC